MPASAFVLIPRATSLGTGTAHKSLPVILFGSHIDSVVHGGNYDGDVGSLGAIEVIRALNESSVKTRHPLEVVIWTNEEGNHFGIGTLGSGIAAGLIGPEILDRKDEKGVTFADWLLPLRPRSRQACRCAAFRVGKTCWRLPWSCTSNRDQLYTRSRFRSAWCKGLLPSAAGIASSRGSAETTPALLL